MYVVATAGHVDHGKSTLVRALTGQEPDRLEEERRRGLSVELGYCWTALPGVGDVAFVDVPGHERFIATTLSGLGPVPVVALVVAADDPWMPQAAEHLRAVDALGVRHGVLVVTRADLADPVQALAAARDELARTSLRDAPSVVVSGRTGTGLDDLRTVLADVLAGVPAPDPDADVRLWLDRRFHVRGAGTVVTGTLSEGTVRVGDVLVAAGREVRVRGLESLEKPRTEVAGVARVALNLAGRLPDGVRRGSALVTPDAFEERDVVDVRYDGRELPHEPVLHLGTAQVGTRARALGPGHARLRLARSLPLRVGDRGLLRDPGSRELWGLEVLDPAPPDLRRRGGGSARAEVLAAWDPSVAGELTRRGVVRRSRLRRLGVLPSGLAVPKGAVVSGDWLVGADLADDLRRRIREAVGDGDAQVADLARRLDLPDPDLVAGLLEPPLRVDGNRVTSGAPDVPPELEAPLAELEERLWQHPFDVPGAEELAAAGLDVAAQARLARAGRLLRVADNVVLLPGADDLAVAALDPLPSPFTTSQARQALATSRRVALPLLKHLDDTGRTVRLADDRRRLRSADDGKVRAGARP